MPRVLVVDDEPLARQRVRDLLRLEPDVALVGEAGSGPEAVEAIRTLRPDVVFLDVQMPDMNGLEVARTVGPEAMPVTVFVTAYDRHALDAFEVAALDYLLKPFDDERFRQALARAREAVRLREAGLLRERLAALLGAVPPPKPYAERLAVEMRGQVRLVPVDAVDYIAADGPYAEVHAGGETFLLREQMQTLEARLDPSRFARIHRSTIVRLDRIDALLVGAGGDYGVRLRDGTRLRVSRSRWDELRRRLGVAEG